MKKLAGFVSAVVLTSVIFAPGKASAQNVNIYVGPGYPHYGYSHYRYGYYPHYGYGYGYYPHYTYPYYGYGYYPRYSYGYYPYWARSLATPCTTPMAAVALLSRWPFF
jgi:hypothetical protein